MSDKNDRETCFRHALVLLDKDLRLHDQPVLQRVLEVADSATLVTVLPRNYERASQPHKAFYLEGLAAFSDQIDSLGQRLYVFRSFESLNTAMDALMEPSRRGCGFDGLVTKDVNNARSEELRRTLLSRFEKEQIHTVAEGLLYEFEQLPFALQEMPKTFTAYRKRVEAEGLSLRTTSPVQSLPPPADIDWDNESMKLPSSVASEKDSRFIGGEVAGLNHLAEYIWEREQILTYKETRNGMLEFWDSTKLSPWLAWGHLSPRQVMKEVRAFEEQKGANESTYWVFFELLWRDYFKAYAKKQGPKLFQWTSPAIASSNPELEVEMQKSFEDWTQGKTGQPFVDACMNELRSTGWMSNRGRQNVASYLSKHLGLDWRKGAEWFADQLIDCDIESNWGNWRYLAGVGTDPRNRKFNIERQESVYDPEGIYRKRFETKS